MDADASTHPAESRHDQQLRSAFTGQAESFNRSGAANDEALLQVLVDHAAPSPTEAWLEAACGPGVISRRLAPLVRSVHGVDLTPAMVDLARRSAAEAGATNASFAVADATATGLPDGALDGAVTRFSLHHIPMPGRLLEELARVVKPTGAIVVADQLADEDPSHYAFTQEAERLRDPSHWASLTRQRLWELARVAGLRPVRESIVPIELDLDDWLRRGGEGPATRRLLDRLLGDPPPAPRFRVGRRGTLRTLGLDVWVARLTR